MIYEAAPSNSSRRMLAGTLLFVTIAVAGLSFVKWFPYWHKAFVAASAHAIGASIITGKAAAPPHAGWAAALQYGKAYFTAVWQAVILALVLGTSVQVFVPRRWLRNLIGTADARGAAIAGALSLGGMMCTCCTAPIVLGLRKQRVSIGSALAFFLGNPVLNPATLIFMGFVLGWNFALLRIVAGVAMIAIAVIVAYRLAPGSVAAAGAAEIEPAPIERDDASAATLTVAWLRELGHETLAILPGYVLIVLLLGAVRAWLFPATVAAATHTFGGLALISLAGTAFVIPTAGEIPIVQMLLKQGLSVGGAVVLLLTLPAISLPSLFIVRGVFPARVLAATFGVVAAVGLAAGAIAAVTFH